LSGVLFLRDKGSGQLPKEFIMSEQQEATKTEAKTETPEPEVFLDRARGEYLRAADKADDETMVTLVQGLRDAVALSHQTATNKKWWDNVKGNAAEIFEGRALHVSSEFAEAWELLRRKVNPTKIWYVTDEHGQMKPEGVPIEIADALIRTFDFIGFFGIDIAEAVRIKLEFNRGRPARHGNKLA